MVQAALARRKGTTSGLDTALGEEHGACYNSFRPYIRLILFDEAVHAHWS
jgi:hypothetical protein